MTAHLSRIAAAVFGGYLFTWGVTVFGIAGLVALGVDFHEAETGMFMLALLVFLAMFLWAFAASSVLRVWLVLAGGGAAMIGAGMALQRMILG
ncbi:MAG: iron uptake protein [Burkholderiaceae bacterium]